MLLDKSIIQKLLKDPYIKAKDLGLHDKSGFWNSSAGLVAYEKMNDAHVVNAIKLFRRRFSASGGRRGTLLKALAQYNNNQAWNKYLWLMTHVLAWLSSAKYRSLWDQAVERELV